MSYRLIAEGAGCSYEGLIGKLRDNERLVVTWLRDHLEHPQCLRVINSYEQDLAPIYERAWKGVYFELQFFATDTKPTPLEYSDYHPVLVLDKAVAPEHHKDLDPPSRP